MHLAELHLTHGEDFQEIDIETDPTAAATVVELNAGNRSVPTLVFADGTVLTEPTKQQLIDALKQQNMV